MSTRLSEAYTAFLAPHPWQIFLTLTFDRNRSVPQFGLLPQCADRAFRRLVLFFNQRLYGRRYRRTTRHKGVVWARVAEAHGDGVLHFHAVLYSPSKPLPDELIDTAGQWWEARYGLAKAETPRSRTDVLRYLTKHVGGEHAEFDFSWNFNRQE